MKKNVLVFFRRDGESNVVFIMKCAFKPEVGFLSFLLLVENFGRRMKTVNFIQLYCIVFSVRSVYFFGAFFFCQFGI